jgi:mono/diheme cytochrome c family protein
MRRAVFLSVALTLLIRGSSASAADQPDFNREVLPLLTAKCFKCHGPDAKHREAGLRLDIEEAAKAKLDSDAVAIVPGNVEASELVARIISKDPDLVMPPPNAKEQLDAKQIETLKRWVAAGAKFEQYWAYAPIQRDQNVQSDAAWGRNAIDHFIYQRLKQEELTPSAEADRVTLIKRLSFDITGLPPTPAEVQAFVNDQSPDAYEKLVDRLLRSEHFGEQMAVYWLDLVRYADSVGYHGDQPISVSPFRDYVINAFNSNMPFDQFTREQLGGDLLPDATLMQKVASGYNRLGMMSAEGGVQPKEYLAKYAAERVRNVSLVWMGTTLGCCECHDHKYDPFTMVDFYSMASFFADIQERGIYSGAHASGKWGSAIDYPDEELPGLLKPIDAQIADVQRVLDTQTPELTEAQLKWEQEVAEAPQWQVVSVKSAAALHNTKLTIHDDGSVLASGASPGQNTYTLEASTNLKGITGFRIEVMPDKSLPQGGPGRAGNGNFVITEFRVRQPATGEQEPTTVELQNASATIEQTAAGDITPYGKWSAASAIDNDVKGSSWGWAILPEVNKTSFMVAEAKADIGDAEETPLQFVIEQNHTNNGHTLGKFRLWATTAPRPLQAKSDSAVPENIRKLLAVARDARSEQQSNELAAYYRSVTPLLQKNRDQLAQLQKQRETVVKQHTRTSHITVSVDPREMRVLPRGNWMDDSGAVVTPTVPHFLRQIEKDDRANRLDLADWLTSDDNPLTARVFVNRLWKLYFGRGICSALDDLGKQGTLPTHPELLDWLAAEFVDSGWNVKHMIRVIAMSATYRQSAISDKAARDRDPYNELLSRQGRFRYRAETIRDRALAVSGLLVPTIGGRSVRPYQPAGYYAHLNFPKREYQVDSGENLWRRSIYTHWQRQFLHPSLMAFDAPSREECAVDRPRSNTPLAALVMLNDPIYVEASRSFAERVLAEAGSGDADRMAFIVREALLRDARADELAVLETVLQKYRQHFNDSVDAAKAFTQIGKRPVPADVDAVELAAWAGVCRVVINAHEFITRN